jgi:hypothetical protein
MLVVVLLVLGWAVWMEIIRPPYENGAPHTAEKQPLLAPVWEGGRGGRLEML